MAADVVARVIDRAAMESFILIFFICSNKIDMYCSLCSRAKVGSTCTSSSCR